MVKDSETPDAAPNDQPQLSADGQQQVRLRVDERDMATAYANGFRTNGTPEEVILDFGLNLPTPQADPKATPEMVFKVTERVILNYYSAKRLAITLSQVIRRHEDQFGELELEANSRRKDS